MNAPMLRTLFAKDESITCPLKLLLHVSIKVVAATTTITEVCNFVSAKHYHSYLPQVTRKKRIFKIIIFFVQDHLNKKVPCHNRFAITPSRTE